MLSVSLSFLPLNYFMEDLLIDCCLWLLVLRVLDFFFVVGALLTCKWKGRRNAGSLEKGKYGVLVVIVGGFLTFTYIIY